MGMGAGKWLAVAAALAVLTFLGYELGRRSPSAPPSSLDSLTPALREAPVPADGTPSAALEDPSPEVSPAVAIVIDDLGRSVETVRRLEALGVDLTYSVLPFEVRTPEVVRTLRRGNREILCHLPMQAAGEADPGPGALTIAMTPEEVDRRTREALASVPGASGVNNHMGSGFSSDAGLMRVVLQVIAEKELYFLDSRTSALTQGFAVARELGLPAAERQVFLDRERQRAAIAAQLEELLLRASERGSAVGIGHPYAETLEVLEEWIPGAVARGFRFVTVGELVR